MTRAPRVRLAVQNQHRWHNRSVLEMGSQCGVFERPQSARSAIIAAIYIPGNTVAREFRLEGAAEVGGQGHGINVTYASARHSDSESPTTVVQAITYAAKICQKPALAPATY